MGFLCSSVGKESAYNAGDPGSWVGKIPLKEMATHPSILALRIPMDCSLPGSSVHGIARVGHDLATKPPLPRIGWRGQRYVD